MLLLYVSLDLSSLLAVVFCCKLTIPCPRKAVRRGDSLRQFPQPAQPVSCPPGDLLVSLHSFPRFVRPLSVASKRGASEKMPHFPRNLNGVRRSQATDRTTRRLLSPWVSALSSRASTYARGFSIHRAGLSTVIPPPPKRLTSETWAMTATTGSAPSP